MRPSKKKPMSFGTEVTWWAYVITGILLIFIGAPILISMADTVAVWIAIVLLLAYARWTWSFWLKKLIISLKQEF